MCCLSYLLGFILVSIPFVVRKTAGHILRVELPDEPSLTIKDAEVDTIPYLSAPFTSTRESSSSVDIPKVDTNSRGIILRHKIML